ncbi:MAG: hypothetical protein NVSMB52_13460 [Chloroflexota bacterium]
MALEPLGWSHGKILYTVATEADTGIYEVGAHGNRFLGILVPQPITGVSLSPDGNVVAFSAPAGCDYCTLNLFDLHTKMLWNGPSGAPSELDLAWTLSGDAVIVPGVNSLRAITVRSHSIRTFARPSGLPQRWVHQVTAHILANTLQLSDLRGVTYQTHSIAGE